MLLDGARSSILFILASLSIRTVRAKADLLICPGEKFDGRMNGLTPGITELIIRAPFGIWDICHHNDPLLGPTKSAGVPYNEHRSLETFGCLCEGEGILECIPRDPYDDSLIRKHPEGPAFCSRNCRCVDPENPGPDAEIWGEWYLLKPWDWKLPSRAGALPKQNPKFLLHGLRSYLMGTSLVGQSPSRRRRAPRNCAEPSQMVFDGSREPAPRTEETSTWSWGGSCEPLHVFRSWSGGPGARSRLGPWDVSAP